MGSMHSGMDLSQFKMVKKDKDATTLRHSKGHEIRIAHKALTPKLKGMLDGLQMFADKGTVEPEAMDDESPATADDTPDATLTDPAMPGSSAAPQTDNDPLGIDAAPQANAEPTPPGNSVMQDQQNGNAPPLIPNVVDQIPADTGNDVSVTAPQKHIVPDPIEHAAERQAEFQDQSKINPKTMSGMWAKSDTPGKMGLAIGMLLSGAGSGLAHQSNALLDVLNKQMDRDLDAQKSSSVNSQNWFRLNQQNEMKKANIKHTNASTDVLAEDATRAQMANAAYFQATDVANGFPPEVRQQVLNRIQSQMEPWRQGVIDKSAQDMSGKLSVLNAKNGKQYQDGVDVNALHAGLFSRNMTKTGYIDPAKVLDASAGYQQINRLHDSYQKAYNNLNTKSAEQLGEAAGVGSGAVSHMISSLKDFIPGAGGVLANAAAKLTGQDAETFAKVDQYRKSQIEPIMARMGPMETGSSAMGAGDPMRDAIFPTVYDMANQLGMDDKTLNQVREAKFNAGEDTFANRAGQFASILDTVPGSYQPMHRNKYTPMKSKKADTVPTAEHPMTEVNAPGYR